MKKGAKGTQTAVIRGKLRDQVFRGDGTHSGRYLKKKRERNIIGTLFVVCEGATGAPPPRGSFPARVARFA